MSAGREIRQLQKAKEKAQRSGNLLEEAALCNQLGEILASHGRYEEALEEHRQELRLLEGAGDTIGCAVAHRKVGERLAELENYEAALKHQRQHLELARSLGDVTEQQRAWATIGRTHMFIAESHAVTGDGTAETALREAEGAFQTSLAIVEEQLEGLVSQRELTEMRSRLYLNLGLVYDSLKEGAKCDQLIQKSIFLAEQCQLLEDLHRAYFNLGNIRQRQGQPSGALRCLARARDCARRMGDRPLESDCCTSTAQVLLSLGDFVAAKRALRQAHALGSRQPWQRQLIRSSLRYASKVMRLQEALEQAVASDREAALALCEQLGDTFSRHGDFSHAIQCYQQQLELAQELGRPPRELAVIHVSLATTFGDLKDHDKALYHYRQELALRQGDLLEEGQTLLNVAVAMEEVGEGPSALRSCLNTALDRAQAANDLRLQRQILRRLHALELRDGDAEAAATVMIRLEGLGGSGWGTEEDEEEEGPESSEAQEESELELSESEGEEDELEGYTKTVPGRRRINKWNRRNERGETPLHRACIEGDLRRVQLFLEQGHPLNPRDYCGWTPLHEACNHGHLEIVRLLLERGAALNDPGGPGCEGITPLHDALSCGHFEVAELLLHRGASVTARNTRGLTPLGTLEEWARTYGPELDAETRQRCRNAMRLLRQVAAQESSQDSLLPSPTEEPGDDGDLALLRPVKKRQRAPELGGAGMALLPQQPALIPADQYLAEENWLEDDLGEHRGGRKRPRWNPQEPAVPVSASGLGCDSDGEVPTASWHRPRRPRQRRLSEVVTRVPTGGAQEHRPPPPDTARTSQTSEEGAEEEQGPPSPTSVAPPAPGPVPGPTLRVRVRVQDNVFLIPVPQGGSRGVSWLAEQAAERFYQSSGLLPRLTLQKEGALLAPQDLVEDVLQSNEEVLAEVQGWDLPPLAQRYQRICQSLAVEPHQLLLKMTELQEQSPGFRVGVGGLALRCPALPPLLRALKLQAPLRELRLRGCGLAAPLVPELLGTLGTLPGLTCLDLAANHLGAAALRQLLSPQPAPTLQNLEELDLSLNPLGDASCQPLAELLRCCPALSTLRLQGCSFGSTFTLNTGAALRLQTLSLSYNPLGPAGLRRLFGDLAGCSLGHLELASVTNGVAQLALAGALGQYLAQEDCVLGHLTLSGNLLDDGDVAAVARLLPVCPALVSLDLSANPSITRMGLWALLRALGERGQGLRLLSLAGCSVETPLDDDIWLQTRARIEELRLCSRQNRWNDANRAWHPAPGTITQHGKLFWKRP